MKFSLTRPVGCLLLPSVMSSVMSVLLLGAVQAQTPAATALTPPAQRLSDPVIQADQKGYDAVQQRIRALNDGGRRLRDYHLSKAQCWLDVSFHEYTRNDRSAFPQEALGEAEKLILAMEGGQALSHDTALVNGAERLRPDLWALARSVRQGPGAECAQAKVACAEVELVHAGNEFRQQQWRHAKPYIQIAEDLIAEAQAQSDACPKPVVLVPPPPAPAASTPAPLTCPPDPLPLLPAEQLRLGLKVYYPTDRHTERDINPPGTAEMNALVQKLTAPGLVYEAIHLVGRADLRAPADYNRTLSGKRVRTVRDYLIKHGIPAERITEEALGADEPLMVCDRKTQATSLYDACLQSNRRVDVYVNGARRR
ncbi:OmpA family protein [Leptothrix ochracea]|uniref:OmpA family protein n=1 Tax=Leptothrix ochracea TaxID=735331 RepID=UPI0034E1A785